MLGNTNLTSYIFSPVARLNCFSAAIICASVCLLFDILPLLNAKIVLGYLGIPGEQVPATLSNKKKLPHSLSQHLASRLRHADRQQLHAVPDRRSRSPALAYLCSSSILKLLVWAGLLSLALSSDGKTKTHIFPKPLYVVCSPTIIEKTKMDSLVELWLIVRKVNRRPHA